GTTDIAVISLGEIVTSASVKIAGNKFDSDILRHIKDKHKLLIGERTAEQIKIQIATVYSDARDETMQVRGRDLVTGLPNTITITSEEIEMSLRESVAVLVAAAKTVLEQTPPELAADIIDRGIVLTGGGALLHGLDKLLSDELLVPVFIAEEPLSCVARGTGTMLENIDKYSLK
ncbi:MAG: rod shape-determining protein, partial [Culicoidibacterales bacterium]